MQIKVYVDILFLINFISDFFLLSLTAVLLKLSPKIIRTVFAACFGALYSLAAFFIYLPFLFSVIAKGIVSFFMVFITFGAKNLRSFIKRICVFYLVTIAFSGTLYAILFSTDLGAKFGTVVSGTGIYLNLPSYILIIAAAVMYFLSSCAFKAIKRSADKERFLKYVRVTYAGKSIILPALYDTGNFLTDPREKKGVIVGEFKALSPLFNDAANIESASLLYGFSQIICRGISGEQRLYSFYAGAGYPEKNTSKRLFALTDKPLDREGHYCLILPNDFKGENLNDGTFIKRFFNSCKAKIFLAKKLARRAGHTRRKLLHKLGRGSSGSAQF